MVKCVKLGREAEGLEKPPFPGKLGERIYESVSKEGWELWTQQMTMIVNEYRLSMANPEAQKMLMQQMELFFFGEGAEQPPPPDYVPPSGQ
jgi:Fe-S cluster biosynthesis and repair protein YggX